MGYGEALPPPNRVSASEQRSAICALPSPASINESLNSPTLLHELQGNRPNLEHRYTQDDRLQSPNALPTERGDIMLESVVTPPTNGGPQPDMNMLVGGALAPVHSNPPPRPPPRSRPGLRLPSFEWLGIAAPHPDRFGGLDSSLTGAVTDGALCLPSSSSGPSGNLDEVRLGAVAEVELSRSAFEKPGGRAIQSPIHHYVDTITPPAEVGYLHWNSMAMVTSAMDSPSTDPGIASQATHAAPAASEQAIGRAGPQIPPTLADADEIRSWIDGAVDVLIANLRSVPRTDSLTILSHALPSPSSIGHVYSEVITALRTSTPASTSPMTWVNVFHAIPGRFNLQDLPRSPPTTPGPPLQSEDYFTEKIFDSAVSIADYQEDLSQLPRSPRPVVPPSSIDVSIVERYIPPSSSFEFADMFDPNGPSILIDRLVELSPNNGSLLFIYPTRSGAETFMREYLGPILDPVLRSTGVVHGVSTELNTTLGNMAAVNQLPDHASLYRSIASLCARLTQRSSATERFHGRRPTLALSYASKRYVKLSRDAWARDWWTKQEKPKIRAAVTKYAREIQMRPSHERSERTPTSTELLQGLIDDVIKKPYQHGQEPEHGIEVSVFVITRTS